MLSRKILVLLLLPVLSSAAFSQLHPLLPAEFTLEPMGDGINTDGNDYAPFTYGDGMQLYFTSYRNGNSTGKADLYLARRIDATTWGEAVNLSDLQDQPGTVNTDRNDGSISFSSRDNTVVLASDRKGGYGDTDIYVGEIENGVVRSLRNIGPAVNTKRWETQPTISSDGNTIVFCSNRNNGVGGMDLWITTRDASGRWSAPVNLAETVNTKSDEIGPALSPDGTTLFFASNRRGGLGGFDIYYSTRTDAGFSDPVNLGAAINSQADEMFMFAVDSSRSFFLATSRAGGLGGLDLWEGRPKLPPPPVVVNEPEPEPVIVETTREVMASFDLGSYNVPFFVTGYYRPNTRIELDRVVDMLDDELREATYIEDVYPRTRRYHEYHEWAKQVEKIFDTVRVVGTETMFPAFERIAEGNEYLEITVTGYADPRPFSGPYVEPEMVTFLDPSGSVHVVQQGDTIGNSELSGLRAWYAAEYLSSLLEQDPTGRTSRLIDSGRIRFRHIGAGVDTAGNQLGAQRRIHISIAVATSNLSQ